MATIDCPECGAKISDKTDEEFAEVLNKLKNAWTSSPPELRDRLRGMVDLLCGAVNGKQEKANDE